MLSGLNRQFAIKFLSSAVHTLEMPAAADGLLSAVLVFLEGLIMTEGGAEDVADFLERIRDRSRELLCSSSPRLVRMIRRLYAVVARTASQISEEKAFLYFNYYKSDVVTDELMVHGDPLLSGLSTEQLKLVVLTTLDALGAMRHPTTVGAIVDNVYPFLHHSTAAFRAAALEAVSACMCMCVCMYVSVSWAHWCTCL
jgi:hypothetical protein